MGSMRSLKKATESSLRERLIEQLVSDFAFPRSLLLKECEISHFLSQVKLPRRIDLLALYKQEGLLLPLLLIECKGIKLHQKHLEQLQGYNYHIRAPFIALISLDQQLLFSTNQKSIEPLGKLRTYEELCLLTKPSSN